MNALTRFGPHESPDLSHAGSRTTIEPPEVAEKLKPARGLVIGLAISVAFWAVVGIGAYLAFHG